MGDVCRMLQGPIATRALQVLADYERAASALLAEGPASQAYRQGSRLFEDLQGLASDLPHARVAWVEVLISRFEFTHALWTAGSEHAARDSARALGLVHLAALARFREKCRIAYLSAGTISVF